MVLARDARVLVILAAGSLSVGLLLNLLRREPLPVVYRPARVRLKSAVAALSGKRPPPRRLAAEPSRRLTLGEFQAFAESGGGWVVDARPAAFYRRGHVPGALNVSRESFTTDYARERGRLAERAGRGMAVYCSEVDCQDSALVADALTKLGSGPVFIYPEGWAEWTRAGLPEEASW